MDLGELRPQNCGIVAVRVWAVKFALRLTEMMGPFGYLEENCLGNLAQTPCSTAQRRVQKTFSLGTSQKAQLCRKRRGDAGTATRPMNVDQPLNTALKMQK